MLDLADPSLVYDAGDVLRRDGACEQRGRFARDDGRFDHPGEVFGACAGAALYRRAAALEVGGFDERFFLYLEDADLALRLRLAGWTCVYEPAVALHAGEGSAGPPERPVHAWAERNTLLLVARAFPWRWAPLVAYRQAAWAWHALRRRRLGTPPARRGRCCAAASRDVARARWAAALGGGAGRDGGAVASTARLRLGAPDRAADLTSGPAEPQVRTVPSSSARIAARKRSVE